MILHIPHSSTQTLDYELNNKKREILRMTDWYTDDLYDYQDATKVVFGLSRLICDVERFEDDDQEAMSRFGMGVCYVTDTQGNALRSVSDEERKQIIREYYKPHHQRLSDAVDKELEDNGSALIIDCHSFPDVAYYFNSDFEKKRPDICIGTDAFHTSPELVQKVQKYFQDKGYDVRVDDPYSGTLVPLKHYHQETNVQGIMIEVNRRLYMNENGSKNDHYTILKNELNVLLESLNNRDVSADIMSEETLNQYINGIAQKYSYMMHYDPLKEILTDLLGLVYASREVLNYRALSQMLEIDVNDLLMFTFGLKVALDKGIWDIHFNDVAIKEAVGTYIYTPRKDEFDLLIDNYYSELKKKRALYKRAYENVKSVANFNRVVEDGTFFSSYDEDTNSFVLRENEASPEEKKIKEILSDTSTLSIFEVIHNMHESLRWTQYPSLPITLQEGIDIVKNTRSGYAMQSQDKKILATFSKFKICKDGTLVTFSTLESSVDLWNVQGNHIATLDKHTDDIWGVISLDNGNILSYSCDNTLRLWNNKGDHLALFEGHTGHVRGAKVLNDGRILSFSSDWSIRIWSADGKPLKVLKEHTSMVADVLILSDGRFVSYAYSHSSTVRKEYSNDGRVLIWSKDGELLKTLEVSSYAVEGVKLLSDNRILAYTKSSLILYDNVGNPIAVFNEHDNDIMSARELSNGKIVSLGVNNNASDMRVWELVNYDF